MSKLIKNADLDRIVIMPNIGDEHLGFFTLLYCETHYDTLCFTDVNGGDHCIKCVTELLGQS